MGYRRRAGRKRSGRKRGGYSSGGRKAYRGGIRL